MSFCSVASYSARGLKTLLLDDVLRPQAIVAGVPIVVCNAIKQWFVVFDNIFLIH